MRDVRRRMRIAAAMMLMLAACQEDPPDALTEGRPDILGESRAACEREGGRWGTALASGFFVCYRTPRDAGKSCRAASDCETHCLARSRTCAPIEPFYGCHEILTNSGLQATQCIQ